MTGSENVLSDFKSNLFSLYFLTGIIALVRLKYSWDTRDTPR